MSNNIQKEKGVINEEVDLESIDAVGICGSGSFVLTAAQVD